MNLHGHGRSTIRLDFIHALVNSEVGRDGLAEGGLSIVVSHVHHSNVATGVHPEGAVSGGTFSDRLGELSPSLKDRKQVLGFVPAALDIVEALRGIRLDDTPVIVETTRLSLLDAVAVGKVILQTLWDVTVFDRGGHPGEGVDIAVENSWVVRNVRRRINDLLDDQDENSIARATETNRLADPDLLCAEVHALVEGLANVGQGTGIRLEEGIAGIDSCRSQDAAIDDRVTRIVIDDLGPRNLIVLGILEALITKGRDAPGKPWTELRLVPNLNT
jgi:hypothetical protein